MKQRRISRFLAFVLLVAMTLSLMPASMAFAEDAVPEEEAQQGAISLVEEPETPDLTAEEGTIKAIDDPIDAEGDADQTWLKVDLADITADDTIAITMTKGDTTWVLPTVGNGGKKQPLVVAGTISNDGNTLTTDGTDVSWTITAVDNGYTITNSASEYLYMIADNNGVRIGSTSAVWSITSDYLTANDTGGTLRYLGVYSGTDWRCYTSINNNIKDQTLNFWKLNTEPVNPEAPATPTASVPSGEVAKDTVVTFGCATEGAVISYSVDGGETWTEGDSYTVTEAVNIKVKATLNGVDSAIATFVYTIEPELGTIAEALAGADNAKFKVKGVVTFVDGRNIYVQDETGGICLYFDTAPSDLALGDTVTFTGSRTTYRGLPELTGQTYEKSEELTLTAKKTTIGELTTADVCTYISLENLTVTAISGDNTTVKDADENTIVIYKAKVTDALAVGDVLNFTGALGIYNTTLQLRNTNPDEIEVTYVAPQKPAAPTPDVAAGAVDEGTVVTFASATEGATVLLSIDNGETWDAPNPYTINGAVTILAKAVKDELESDLAAYAYTIKTGEEPITKTGFVTDLADLTDGAKVVILNKANKMALSQEYTGYYNKGVAVTVTDGVLAGYGETEIWTVGVNEDGSYTFSTADGKKLSMAASRTSIPLDDANPNWSITAADGHEDGFYIENTGRAGYVIEWYASNNNWSAYNNNTTGELFIQQFYLVGDEIPTPPQPTGDDYGLTSTLADGDTVILYNAKNSVALGNTISSHKVSGVSLTPTDGVITTDNTAVAWTVTVNDDGTYTFTQGDYTLGGVVSGSYNNLVVTEATYTKWTLTGPDATDFNYFMYLGDMANNFGKTYLEYYNGFTLYGSSAPDKDAFGITFYKKGAEPETPAGPGETGDLVTSLSQLTDGVTVAIYSPSHGTAISTKPNGDWYLKANAATVNEEGKVVNFTSDLVWKVKVNSDGSYSFYANDDETRCISVWPSGTYAELTVNPEYNEDTVHDWNLLPFNSQDHTWYIKSTTLTIAMNNTNLPVYIEAYIRNELFEVFSGYAPYSNQLSSTDYALQFYLVNPDDAIAAFDDGEWDGVLNKGEQYLAYNIAAESSMGLFKEANYALDAIPTTVTGDTATAGNGAYAFRVDSMGRYYSFEVNGKYLATNDAEELFFIEKDADGKLPDTAKWYLKQKNGSYLILNKEAQYGGTPVCIEYFSSVFSGWTYSTKNDVNIYLFDFYKPSDDTKIYDDVVQDPSVIFACEDSRYVEQDYVVSFSLDDLAESITSIAIGFTAGERTGTVTEYEVSSDGKTYSFTIPAADIDGEELLDSFTIQVAVTNSYDISYTGEKVVTIIDEPFFTELTPAPNSQTKDEKRPVISAKIGNAGENPTVVMKVNGETVEAAMIDGTLVYTPAEDMTNGRATVSITVQRADGVSAEKTWNFTVGYSEYQLYFGQLHSHTTYSDGSGSLDTALEYIASLPESANVQFVAFTDHSNYFDTTSAANPAAALNDQSLMTEASRALWNEYKGKVDDFNAGHEDLLAIAGFEMTWSGGPGHINTFDSDGLVSRNNAELNNKTGDAGMKLYYETINAGDSLNQFNHPGSTFGNFTDFSYWDEATDAHMFLVEVGNGEGQIGAGGYYPSYEEYILALDKGWHVAPTNNQDNHKGRWGNANDARDVVLTNDFSEEGIYDAIRNLRVYATEDKNLQIFYTINDKSMGTIFSDEEAPEELNVVVTLFDPDSSDGISKVELVANGGTVAYTWDNSVDLASGQLSAVLTPEYSYYFVRVTQSDGDLAVTAPVWVGHAAKLGITDIKADAEQVYINEETSLTTTLYNNEAAAATVKSLIYTIKGGQVIGTDTNTYTIPAGGTVAPTFTHTFDKAKLTTVTVTAIVELDGKEYTYSANVELDVLDREHAGEVTTIADVRSASDPNDTGYRFIIEGVVTSNASGFDKDTAFFDCVYVQDETAGICCFPISGEYKIGDKVRIVGHTDFYQGEPELQVQTIEVIGEGTVEPTAITAAELNDRSAEGKLVTITGTVDSVEEANGLIQTIMIKDAEGDLARVFIDGYITTENEVENCIVGAQISATGLASYDDTFNAPDGPFPRIRIRNRADIVCTEALEQLPVVVTGKSLSLKGNIEVNFYLDIPETLLADAGAYVTINGEKTLISEASTRNVRGVSTRIFTVKVKFAHLQDEQILRVYNGKDEPVQLLDSEGNDLTETGVVYHAQDYIEYIRANSEETNLRALVNALSDLGSLAQLQFKYNADSRANVEGDLDSVTADMVEDHEMKLTAEDGAGIRYYGSSLLLQDITTIRHYFKLDGGAIEDYRFTIGGEDVTPVQKGNYYYIDIGGIVAKDLDRSFHVEVRKGDDVVIGLDYSALSYAYQQLRGGKTGTLTDLVKAMVLYSKAAEEYFTD